ncbi:TonB-dependent receptor [Rivibacter subsaxonicus]|uniref:TonB-dependent receptor n=1 Tax=Rivibacter subsaxonicus TaxID=457575 RepID=UPI001A937A8C|nr:TonB-dependent receptor [Rivibacter subsaxonicus]
MASATLPDVEVIGTSPLPGQGIDRDLLPYSTQLIRRERIDAAKADTLSDLLNRRVPGVQLNEVQGSPFQSDLTYRGFRASALLGTSAGISAYLDGVRMNEPFGDVINFDLIPEFSVSSLSLVPGANPAFGLNSLGGALAYTTFDGRSAPGLRAELSGGSFGRGRLDLSYGANFDSGWHAYFGATGFKEDGWRDFSEGRLGNLLAKVGHDDGTTAWTLSGLYGQSKLVGNGLVPWYTIEEDDATEAIVFTPDLYANRREAVYTHPDQTQNRLGQLTLNLRHTVDAQSTLSGLVYVRNSRRETVNGDEAEEFDEEEPEVNAAFNTTETEQTGYGAAIGFERKSGAHQWQVGATLDASKVRYRQFEQEGSFTPDRGVAPLEGEERELSVDVDGRSLAWGAYASDTWQLGNSTWLTGTLRFNWARVENTLSSVDDDTDEFEVRPRESFSYKSLNPALGIAHRLGEGSGGPTLFANIARNNRVPTVIELGCADPEEPCRLPAGLQADPFLEQVTSTTVEAGVRWRSVSGWRANFEAYRSDNRNDILFRSVSVNGQLGYFANFPKTRHQGADLELGYSAGPLDLSAGFSFLDATYQADGVLRQGERNVTITRGTRIANLPRQMLKLSADWRLAEGFSLGADLQAFGRRGVAGNEDGLIEDDGDEQVDLSLPGYGILNLRASWQPSKSWELYVKLNNATDKRSQSFGALAETVFNADGSFNGDDRDALFVGPGAPRSVFVGLRLRY